MDKKLDDKVTTYINSADEKQIPLLEELRQTIHNAVPGSVEAIKWGFPVFAKSKDYAYLRFAKNHLTLGFYNIDNSLSDPDNRLEGTGNKLRHIKIKSKEDIDSEQISRWLKSITK